MRHRWRNAPRSWGLFAEAVLIARIPSRAARSLAAAMRRHFLPAWLTPVNAERGKRPSVSQEERMNELTFDVLARRAATSVSRRASLLTLGTVGLTALMGPISVTAKSKNKKKKSDKKDKQQCQQDLAECTEQATQCAEQVEPCISFLTVVCGDDPGCLAQQGPCCDFLEGCDASEFILCLLY